MRARRATRFGHFRRTACVGVVAAGAVTTAFGIVGGPGAQAQEAEFNKGVGQALAQSIRVNPVAGGLSFGVTIAETLAGHQNTVASAESRSANLGVIGTTLSAEGCDGGDPTLPSEDQPQALRVDSTEEGAADGKSGQDDKVPGVDRSVRATTDPYAESLASGGAFEIPGVLRVGNSTVSTHSGVIDGNRREAVGVSEIGSLVIAGVIELRDLRWEAIHRTGAIDEQQGTFTIGGMTIAGTPVPVGDPVAALAQANDVLRPLGLEIRPPRYHLDDTAKGSIATVDPMAIRVIPSPTRDGILGPVLGGIQPARQDIFQALIDADCGNASFITILDIVLNAFGAGGFFGIELGGASASTGEITLFEGLGTLGPLPPLGAVPPASGSSTGGGSTGGASSSSGSTAGSPPSATGAPSGGAGTGGGGAEEDLDDAENAVAEGSRGGALAAVGGTGLLALLATAEGDRRKMRRAQREIPLEA